MESNQRRRGEKISPCLLLFYACCDGGKEEVFRLGNENLNKKTMNGVFLSMIPPDHQHEIHPIRGWKTFLRKKDSP